MNDLVRPFLLNALLFLIVLESKSQSFGIIKDSTTNEPVPFVNIWVNGESIGTTSNEKGEFQFEKSVNGKGVVLSSIGYKVKKISFVKNGETILLIPEIIQLKEVIINGSKKEKKNTLGENIKPSGVRLFFFCDGMPYMKARFFPYKDEFSKTPFLSKVEIVTSSSLDNATFNLRLYTMGKDKKPDKPLYNENIIVAVKKGRNLTSIDLTDRSIEFPTTGLLIAFEYLIVEKNEFTLPYTIPPDTAKLYKIVYAPSVGTVPAETANESWIYNKGNWKEDDKNSSIKQKGYENKYDKLAISVTLTN